MNDKDKHLRFILDNLERLNFDKYMNLCYNIIVSFPHNILSYDDVSALQKMQSLDKLIAYFEEREEYEKCNEIKKVQTLIKKIKIC